MLNAYGRSKTLQNYILAECINITHKNIDFALIPDKDQQQRMLHWDYLQVIEVILLLHSKKLFTLGNISMLYK